MSEHSEDSWFGCYGKSWSDIITLDSVAHPAKFSRRLIHRIYEHVRAEGWLPVDSTVVDPFGGVALGAAEAMRLGAHWVGCELELRFCDMGAGYDCPGFTARDWRRFHGKAASLNGKKGHHWCPSCIRTLDGAPVEITQESLFVKRRKGAPSEPAHHYTGNLDLFRRKRFPGTGHLIQGDSRRLSEVLKEASICVSSPPYARALGNAANYADMDKAVADAARDIMQTNAGASSEKRYGSTPGNLGNLKADEGDFSISISSPPFLDQSQNDSRPLGGIKERRNQGGSMHRHYGDNPAQLGAMPDKGFDLSVASPPWGAGAEGTLRGQKFRDPDAFAAEMASRDGKNGRHAASPQARRAQMERDKERTYGDSEGQLGAMPNKGFDLACSSPPYENSVNSSESGIDWDKAKRPERWTGNRSRNGCQAAATHVMSYGKSDAQVGAKAGDDFWAAARQIVEQTFLVLAPGAHAVWVVKGFIRSKKYIDFPDQWRQICEAVGFKTLHWHNASLVEGHGMQTRLDGSEVAIETRRISFFRRLAESKGSPRIEAEVVLCMLKPAPEATF